MSAKPMSPSPFLNGPNYQNIVGFLRQRYTQKLGMNALPERMDLRIQKTVQHYMQEIDRVHVGKNVPVQSMNQEVLRETTQSLDNWIRKQETTAAPAIISVGTPSRADERSMIPVPELKPDAFDDEDPVILMQRMQKQREEQARALGLNGPKLEIREDSPSAMNPVPPQANAPPPQLAPRPQEYIIPQEDIVKYRETEHNIFLTSSDRDWLRNTAETRYNFSVNFNTGTKRTGFPFNAALQERFRNIQRIEFVKVILPLESLQTLPRVVVMNPTSSPSYSLDLARVINVFSLPFLGVRIAELNNNGFSTNPSEDNTFAIVQYDTTWSSDLVSPVTNNNMHGLPTNIPLTKSGYSGFIPKFLKTQKIYTPTPLATLQKLSIRVENHSGQLLSTDSDVWSIKAICMGGSADYSAMLPITSANYSIYSYLVNASLTNNDYIFVQTTSWFPFSAIAEGDTIQFQDYALTTATYANQAFDFQNFINQSQGHTVVATAYTNSGYSSLIDGRNAQGYCNVIIIRNRFDDPSTGSTQRSDNVGFGGSIALEKAFVKNYLNTTNVTSQTNCSLINLSRQTHIVLRIITRELDSSSNIRPDNV